MTGIQTSALSISPVALWRLVSARYKSSSARCFAQFSRNSPMPTANAMATYSQARGVRPSTDLRRPDEGGGTDEDIRWTGSGGSPHSGIAPHGAIHRSEEHTSELQSLMRSSYAVFCLKKKTRAHQSTLLTS